jgi:hypothetical protein
LENLHFGQKRSTSKGKGAVEEGTVTKEINTIKQKPALHRGSRNIAKLALNFEDFGLGLLHSYGTIDFGFLRKDLIAFYIVRWTSASGGQGQNAIVGI